MVDAQLHLAADLERRAQEHIQGVVDGALARILDRHHAKVGDAAFERKAPPQQHRRRQEIEQLHQRLRNQPGIANEKQHFLPAQRRRR